jgi:hypothetical protein
MTFRHEAGGRTCQFVCEYSLTDLSARKSFIEFRRTGQGTLHSLLTKFAPANKPMKAPVKRLGKKGLVHIL